MSLPSRTTPWLSEHTHGTPVEKHDYLMNSYERQDAARDAGWFRRNEERINWKWLCDAFDRDPNWKAWRAKMEEKP